MGQDKNRIRRDKKKYERKNKKKVSMSCIVLQ